ncbi:lysozyme inhibitor LprI family protein [Paracoccus methylarcula]|uniref:DUF1311 domain-containing protein n=1 Tax=Paracoccus methylarcula TaxID=72022 RepID=A0A3R7LHJ3_9RHOB|nr:lysozyme inhibitor LprI family protein [Paracoccus methylarcula]RNF34095.1 DUF1311 domain-containing protein [Paracoccus methylarcula]
MRGLVVVFMVMAGAAMAQDGEMPVLDPSLLETCLDNASLRAEQGEERDAESCIGVAAEQCMEGEGGYSSYGMFRCLQQEADLWDARLNDAYSALMASAKRMDREAAEEDSPAGEQAPLLKDMQKRWIEFRDAACSYEYSRWGMGSGRIPAGENCHMTLTARQAIWLEEYRREDGGN